MFVTQKEKVDKLPESRGTKIAKKQKENKSSNIANPADDILGETDQDEKKEQPKQFVKGVTYRKLKPEVKSTLEKVVY